MGHTISPGSVGKLHLIVEDYVYNAFVHPGPLDLALQPAGGPSAGFADTRWDAGLSTEEV